MHRSFRQMKLPSLPDLLQEIPDPPKLLYIEGELPPQTDTYLAVVGSRKMSAYGKRVCQQLILGLRGSPIAVVSGLALGIDSVAHESALEAGLKTVAVLPSGLADSAIYPTAHRNLAHRIVKSGGALMSEYEPEEKPRHWTFLERNRIVAGLCHATLVIEAPERSGALVTAKLALEYNRDVFAVPHPIESETGAGTNGLIRRGAVLIRSSADILDSLNLVPQTFVQTLPLADLSDDELLVYEALGEARDRGELQEITGLPQQKLNVAISLLSIKGVIAEELGKLLRK